ncbi:VOC family protein [Nocardiopsis nanhaiensis]
MLLTHVTVGTTDMDALERFHRDTLLLPVDRISNTTVEVQVGTGTVRYEQRPQFAGAHHLAFSIAPEDFDQAHAFLADRVDISPSNGSSVVYSASLDSRSVYFNAPEGLILEYIAHESHRGHGGIGGPPAPLGIAEVGIGVADVAAAVGELNSRGLASFAPPEKAFATVGTIDNRLVIVDRDRFWFPEMRNHPATDTSTISIKSEGAVTGRMSLDRAELIIT